MMDMPDRIHSLRKAKGISREAFADAVGVFRQAVSKWEGEARLLDNQHLASVFFSLYFACNVLLAGSTAPYPILGGSVVSYLAFWLAYGSVCLGVTMEQVRKGRGR